MLSSLASIGKEITLKNRLSQPKLDKKHFLLQNTNKPDTVIWKGEILGGNAFQYIKLQPNQPLRITISDIGFRGPSDSWNIIKYTKDELAGLFDKNLKSLELERTVDNFFVLNAYDDKKKLIGQRTWKFPQAWQLPKEREPRLPAVLLPMNITEKIQSTLELGSQVVSAYELLSKASDKNISKDSSPKNVTSAYRKAALKWHPDKAVGRDVSKETAEEVFKAIGFAKDRILPPSSQYTQ